MSTTGGKNTQDWLCKFQFFDRDTGQWSSLLAPQIGFGETFVQDETTDDASLNFKWRSSAKPNIKHMQWARILHFHKGDNMVATYDENGLPLNHSQYVIGDFQMAQSKDKSYWLVKLSLLEPIERMRFVVGETLAYTNQTSKTVTDGSGNTVTYIKEPYNHLTALERFLKVTPANCDNYDEGYNPHNNKSWFNRIKILDKDFLKNIPFDSDSFTEPDLYTILFKYDKSTGRTPCMFFDMDTETDLPRNLDRDEYILKFLRQDGFDKPVLNLSDITANAQNVTYKSSLSNFATGVVSNVENLVTGSNLAFPSQNFWAAPELNSTQRDTTAADTPDSGWGIKFPCPIKKINKIKILKIRLRYENYNLLPDEYKVGAVISDGLEKFCYEDQQYLVLTDDEKESMTELYHYAEGDDFLYIKNYYYASNGTDGRKDYSYWYYIEFEPFINPKLELGNTEYQTIYNQVDSQLDAFKYYKYLHKYLQSMGKSDLTIIKKHYHPEEMYEIGSLVYDEENDKRYMITGSSYQNLNFELLAVYQLNENHFRRNNSVKANKSIRSNIAISYQNIQERKTSFNKIIKIGFENNQQNSDIGINLKKLVFSSLLDKSQIGQANPQIALFEIKSVLTKNDATIENYERTIAYPINTFFSNNTICFNILMPNNAYCGNSKTLNYTSSSSSTRFVHEYGSVQAQIPVLYTDPLGEIGLLNIFLCNLPNIDVTQYLTNGNASNGDAIDTDNVTEEIYQTLVDSFIFAAGIPQINDSFIDSLKLSNIYALNNINYYKDMLERLNITLSFQLDNEDIIFCQQFLQDSILNGNNSNVNYIVKCFSKNKTEYDSFKDASNQTFNVTVEETNNSLVIKIDGDFSNQASVVFLDNLNNPLLIINNIDKHIYNNSLNICI